MLKIDVKRWFWGFIRLIGSLVELHAWWHSYLCFSLLEKLFLSNLDSFSTPPRHLAIYRAFQLLLTVISIASRMIELLYSLLCWIVPRQILNSCIYWNLYARHLSTPLFVEIYWTPIYMFNVIRFSLFSISLSTNPSLHLPDTLFSIKTINPRDFQTLLASNHLVCSLFFSFFMHFMHLDLGFGIFEKFYGFSKILMPPFFFYTKK